MRIKQCNIAKNHQTKTPNSAQITFGGYKFDLKKVRNLPCAACGRKMTTLRELDDFKKELNNSKKLELKKILTKIKLRFPEKQKSLITKVRNYTIVRKDLDFKGILKQFLKEHSMSHSKINFNKQELSYIKKLSEIKDFNQFVETLFSPTMSSVDHIHPRNFDSAKSIENYILMCKNCNSQKSSYLFSLFMFKNPDMITNLKKHIHTLQKIEEKSTNKPLKKVIQEYLPALKQTINNELSSFVSSKNLEDYIKFLFDKSSDISKKNIKQRILSDFENKKQILEQLEKICKKATYGNKKAKHTLKSAKTIPNVDIYRNRD